MLSPRGPFAQPSPDPSTFCPLRRTIRASKPSRANHTRHRHTPAGSVDSSGMSPPAAAMAQQSASGRADTLAYHTSDHMQVSFSLIFQRPVLSCRTTPSIRRNAAASTASHTLSRYRMDLALNHRKTFHNYMLYRILRHAIASTNAHTIDRKARHRNGLSAAKRPPQPTGGTGSRQDSPA